MFLNPLKTKQMEKMEKVKRGKKGSVGPNARKVLVAFPQVQHSYIYAKSKASGLCIAETIRQIVLEHQKNEING